jgi:hypothetical protein
MSLRIDLPKTQGLKYLSWRQEARKHVLLLMLLRSLVFLSSADGDLNTTVPFYCLRATPNTPTDWNYTSIPQARANNRSVAIPRGFALGGSSAVSKYNLYTLSKIRSTRPIDFMAYMRGTSEDWDRYARVSGDPGWSWDRMQKYFLRVCHILPHIFCRPDIVTSSIRTRDGWHPLTTIILMVNSTHGSIASPGSTPSVLLGSLYLSTKWSSMRHINLIVVANLHSGWITIRVGTLVLVWFYSTCELVYF